MKIFLKGHNLICFKKLSGDDLVKWRLMTFIKLCQQPIHQDHYVRLLVEKLSEQGKNYHWTWAYNHIGYDRYHECGYLV